MIVALIKQIHHLLAQLGKMRGPVDGWEQILCCAKESGEIVREQRAVNYSSFKCCQAAFKTGLMLVFPILAGQLLTHMCCVKNGV